MIERRKFPRHSAMRTSAQVPFFCLSMDFSKEYYSNTEAEYSYNCDHFFFSSSCLSSFISACISKLGYFFESTSFQYFNNALKLSLSSFVSFFFMKFDPRLSSYFPVDIFFHLGRRKKSAAMAEHAPRPNLGTEVLVRGIGCVVKLLVHGISFFLFCGPCRIRTCDLIIMPTTIVFTTFFKFVVWTIPSLSCLTSSLYTFLYSRLGSGLPLQDSPNLSEFALVLDD
jgi:hypothetical protein